MQDNIVALEQAIALSVGDSRHATDWATKHVTWKDFIAKMARPVRTRETLAEYAAMSHDQRSEVKDVGGFVGGTIAGGNRKGANVQDRQLISLDADFATEGLWDNWEMFVGRAALLHSTHSHTAENPRLRLIVPLSRPVSPDEYEPIARRLADLLGIDAFDDTTYQPARLMYWPSCPKDAEFVFKSCDGDWVDPDEVLATYDNWRDMRYWPVSSRRQKVIRKMGEKQGDPLTKPGVIGAFNRVYSITDAIVKFLPSVYIPCGGDRWTYAAGSTVGGAVAYDSDTFLYSHHDTDPTSGRLCSAFDLVRIHLYGELDQGADDGSLTDLPSHAAMKALCAKDEAVRAELADNIRKSPEDVFDVQDELERFTDDLTEQGAAVEFVDRFGSRIRYSGSFGWMFWDGQRWVLNAEPEVYMLVLQYADDLYGQARVALQAAEDKNAQDRALALYKQAVRLRSSSGQKGLMTQVQRVVNEPKPESYDALPWDLNTPDGIIDLRSGEMRPHDPRAKCTKITAFGVEADSDDAEWHRFISYVTGGDVDFARYIQTLAGMAAVGAVYEEGLVISYGSGGNGKSTLFGVLRSVLGEYARSVNPDVLTTTSTHTDQSYVAALRGCRLAIMGETEEGARFGVAQMKRLTSRDTISARQLYKDPIEFDPTHTTIMHTNHLPRLNSLDGGTRRRIAVAPFTAAKPPQEVITNYEQQLTRRCGAAVLRWIVEGAKIFYTQGCKLQKPECVLKATEEYLSDEDWLAQYLTERCEQGRNKQVSVTALLLDYRAWAERQGEYVRKRNDFQKAMEMRGFSRAVTRDGRFWIGIDIREDDTL